MNFTRRRFVLTSLTASILVGAVCAVVSAVAHLVLVYAVPIGARRLVELAGCWGAKSWWWFPWYPKIQIKILEIQR